MSQTNNPIGSPLPGDERGAGLVQRELETILERVERRTASADDRQRLNSLLAADAACRGFYAAWMKLNAELAWYFSPPQPPSAAELVRFGLAEQMVPDEPAEPEPIERAKPTSAAPPASPLSLVPGNAGSPAAGPSAPSPTSGFGLWPSSISSPLLLGFVAALGTLVVLAGIFLARNQLGGGKPGVAEAGTGQPDAVAGRPSEVVSGSVLVAGVPSAAIPLGAAISVAGEKPAVIRLGDGSQAELEPGASAVLQGRTSGMRQLIELAKGSGTFRVEHAHGDFRVATALGSVTAVGTEFSVRIVPPQRSGETVSEKAATQSRGATMAVAVLEGTVQVESGGRTVLVHHGENVVFGDAQPEAVAANAPATGKTLEIKLGTTIRREWEDVKQAGYAYGPKQEYEPLTGQTHVFLPYGNKGEYFETAGVVFTDPGSAGTGVSEVHTIDGNTSGRLVYKLHFDKPTSGFRIFAGWSEWGVTDSTVGGIEYSTDGQKWTVIREAHEARIIEPFIVHNSFMASGLKTQELYIRCYSRDKNHPEADSGPGRWMKLRMAGDPAWGDASQTFFKSQLQVWLIPAK